MKTAAKRPGKVEQAIRSKHPYGSLDLWIGIEITTAGSIRAAAEGLDISPRTLQRWIKANGFILKFGYTCWLEPKPQNP